MVILLEMLVMLAAVGVVVYVIGRAVWSKIKLYNKKMDERDRLNGV